MNKQIKYLAAVIAILGLGTLGLTPRPASAAGELNQELDTSNVLVVYNINWSGDDNNNGKQDSLELKNYYLDARHILDGNVIGLDMPDNEESISYANYDEFIAKPILEHINKNNLMEQIRVIVLMKGIPLKIEPTNPNHGSADYASVDSTLTWLGRFIDRDWRVDNPYYNLDRFASNGDIIHFRSDLYEELNSAQDPMRYLVTRLDGYTYNDVRDMIDRGSNPYTKSGAAFLIDADPRFSDKLSEVRSELINLGADALPNPWKVTSHNMTDITKPLIGWTHYGSQVMGKNCYQADMFNFNLAYGSVVTSWNAVDASSLRMRILER